MVPSIRRELQAIDPQLPLFRVTTLEREIGETLAQPRFQAVLLAVFALIALLLATIGIYGVTSHAVGQRTQEVGIRMAMGAARRDVLRLMLVQHLRPALIGLALGLAGALALSRFLQSLLFGVGATDPATFAPGRGAAGRRRRRLLDPGAPRHARRSRDRTAERLTSRQCKLPGMKRLTTHMLVIGADAWRVDLCAAGQPRAAFARSRGQGTGDSVQGHHRERADRAGPVRPQVHGRLHRAGAEGGRGVPGRAHRGTAPEDDVCARRRRVAQLGEPELLLAARRQLRRDERRAARRGPRA